jgi:hypothetical protein
MLAKIFLGLAAVLLVLVVVIALRPADFRVSRSTTIAAPASAIFSRVNDLHQWEAWSPWTGIDPAMKVGYEGPATGVGSSYTWSGNNEVGEGRSTVTESRLDEVVRFKLEMKRPFVGSNDVEFAFKPEGAQTVVTWSMAGKNNFMSKAVGLFMDCEKMCGDQFEQGLAKLKALVESPAAS